MKRFFTLFLVSAILLSAAGCAGSVEDSQSTTDNSTSTAAEDIEQTRKTAAELAKIVQNSVEFPQTVNVTDKDQIEAMGIDLSIAEDYAVVQQMLSVDVVEIVILRVKEDNMETAVESLQKRKESLIHDFAFYPGQVESAEATVVGSKGDIAYLICHKNADTAETELLKNIGSR